MVDESLTVLRHCRRCERERPLACFARNRSSKDGWRPECKECRRQRDHENHHPMIHRDRVLRHRYGITHADYTRMLVAQGGVCAICGGEEPRNNGKFLCVDHDHETGRVRGLLCTPCNLAIGFISDPSVLAKAISYLDQKGGQ